jgi:hypothetical protein
MNSNSPSSTPASAAEVGLQEHAQIDAVKQIPAYVLQRFRPVGFEQESPRHRWDRGYLVSSTAPNNVEDPPTRSGLEPPGLGPSLRLDSGERASREENLRVLRELANALQAGGDDPEIIIAVHGFSNNLQAAVRWYSDIYNHLSQHPVLAQRNLAFLGYRWPSERPMDPVLGTLRGALQALPTLPRELLAVGASLSLGLFVGACFFPPVASSLFAVAVPPLLFVGVLVALLVERIVVYFRDGYRASYFAAPDLVEFVRDLDGALQNAEITLGSGGRVKISFLAHSLGCSITTNALRVLSDVFAQGSEQTKEIGQKLILDRLVLVAPDIPVESVIPRRSNVLASALRRVNEVHVFTNEGDLALRLASTAANYFSFPARSRFSGYRLGNLTLKHFRDSRDRRGSRPSYGVVSTAAGEVVLPSSFLEIRASSSEHRHLWESPFFPWVADDPEDVTNKINYYDCTDYVDVLDCVDPGEGSVPSRGVVSRAIKAPALNLPAYFRLILAYLRGPARGGVDTHGGYFHGRTSKEWIYTLAFAGFAELLRCQGPALHKVAQRYQLQVLLSCAQQQAYEESREGRGSALPPSL